MMRLPKWRVGGMDRIQSGGEETRHVLDCVSSGIAITLPIQLILPDSPT